MKYFTEEQLAQEARSLPELALDALGTGDVERLLVLLNQMSVGHAGLVDLGLHWTARMLGKIRADFGEAFLDELLAKSAAFLMKPYAEEFLGGQDKEVVSELILMLRSQIGSEIVPIGETDDEIAFSLSPCGSGGRLLLEGWPDTLPQLYSACSDGTPIYCKMCNALQQALNEACDATVWTTRINDAITGACETRFCKAKASARPLFDQRELYTVAKPRCRQALEKVLAGDFDIAELIKDQQLEWKPWHDLFVQLATCLLSAVHVERGADYLDEFLRETYDTAFGSIYGLYDLLDDVAMFRMMVQTWHYHMATFTFAEEEDRFVFSLDPCGSGGRLYRSDMHKGKFRYGTGLTRLMGEPANINFNRHDFPVYCTHCASTNRDQFEGHPFVFVIDGHAQKEPGSPCTHYLYKKAANREISPELLAQVGKSKVDPL